MTYEIIKYMEAFKQTWWDNNLPNRFEEFNSWIGDKNAQSKIFCRNLVKDWKYKSLIDLGCGTATEYFAYKEEYPELVYTGIDSCEVLFNKNQDAGIPMILSAGETVPLPDNCVEVVFARHILEHQPKAEPVLEEMIRLSSKVAMHVFFMIPRQEPESIGYDSKENLYHNRYDKDKIEAFLNSHSKVKSFEWLSINPSENVLVINV